MKYKMSDLLKYKDGNTYLRIERVEELQKENDRLKTLLERSDNSGYAASPKLPSLKEFNRLLDLKYPTRQDMRKCMWLGKEIINKMKKLGNFA